MQLTLPLLLIATYQTQTQINDDHDFVDPLFRASAASEDDLFSWPRQGSGNHYDTHAILASVRIDAATYLLRVLKQDHIPGGLSTIWKGVHDTFGYRLYFRCAFSTGAKLQVLESDSAISITFKPRHEERLESIQEAKSYLETTCRSILATPDDIWSIASVKLRKKSLSSNSSWFSGSVSFKREDLHSESMKRWWKGLTFRTDGKVLLLNVSKPEYEGGSATGAPSLPGKNRFTGGQ